MTLFADRAHRWVLALVLVLSSAYMQCGVAAPVDIEQAAPNTVAKFNGATWRGLLRSGPHPAAYVFTNSFCTVCPEVFALLQQTVGAAESPVDRAAILMDVQGERAWAAARHYQGATQVYAFEGDAVALRKLVDPQWHNITPYVVLVGRKGGVQRITGVPNARQLRDWLG